VKAAGIKKTVLLTSDTLSRTISTPALVSLQSVKSEDDLRTFTKSYIPVAVLLEGKFSSLYANRLTTELKDTLSAYTNRPFSAIATKEAKQIVVSDGDIVTNVVTTSQGPLTMGMQQYENYQFANKEFLMNAVDFLVNPNGVLETRNKDITLRLLDRQKILTGKTMWQVINIVIPVSLVLLFGWLYQYKRRKSYAV
jgi:gliding-associated putative ABC transporter substrate-binding component GldG